VKKLESKVEALEATLKGVTHTANTITFSGVNVKINNGAGQTATANGLGNLVIGYDENTGHERPLEKPGQQTGSHNLILGQEQEFTSYGSIIGGELNTSTGQFTDVFGRKNTASGPEASASGGYNDKATREGASVSGGRSNTAGELGRANSVRAATATRQTVDPP
jgi:hypothetical protein